MKKVKNKKKVVASRSSHEIVVRVQPMAQVSPTVTDLAEPMRDGKKLTIPKTWVSSGQLTQILQVTPKKYVYQKPGKGGGKFDYVTTSYVTKALNYIFGWNWDFEVIEHGIEGGQVWVKGKLTVRGTQVGEAITKTQFGRNDIKYKRGTKDMLDFGNDMKGAASDSLKKCASMLGIASDIYGKSDYKMESGNDAVERTVLPLPSQETQEVVMKQGQIIGPDGYPTYACSKCGDPISDQEAEFSKKMFNKYLCREHQAEVKNK